MANSKPRRQCGTRLLDRWNTERLNEHVLNLTSVQNGPVDILLFYYSINVYMVGFLH